jgi:3-methyl-2-oxobutanoate hydroxymethyltransferase
MLQHAVESTEKTTIAHLLARKRERRPIPMLTCYDFSTARLLAEAGIDVILVGDTYGEVCLGHSSTLPVTVDHLVTVTEAVRRGAPNAFLVGDMPFLSYQISPEEAIRNAGRFMSVAGCDCVKVEVDRRLAATVEAMSRAAIPVMAHLGLKPQSVHHLGGYRCQGKKAEDALRIIEDAAIMEEMGAVALLLEAVTNEVARIVAQRTRLPVIGCVSGPHCDGQVLVLHDILGYTAGHRPKSVRCYANLHETLTSAFARYADDVLQREFPRETDGVSMPAEEFKALRERIPDSD